MIDPVTEWFEITKYNNKGSISIEKLVQTTWMSRYPRSTEITYAQGYEFIDHEFRKYLVVMVYGIISKPSTLGNPMSNVIWKRIHQVLGNLIQTCTITQT